MQFFDRSRAYVAAHGVGLAQGALDLAIQHVRTREQFGQKIASFQATQFKIAEMATKVELARTLTHKACSLLDHGRGDSNTTAMAKLFSGRTAGMGDTVTLMTRMWSASTAQPRSWKSMKAQKK